MLGQILQQRNKRIIDLSRNLLVIVCEYLAFADILQLSASNKNILRKLDDCFEPNGCATNDNASYLKRRGILYFQTFFF